MVVLLECFSCPSNFFFLNLNIEAHLVQNLIIFVDLNREALLVQNLVIRPWKQ